MLSTPKLAYYGTDNEGMHGAGAAELQDEPGDATCCDACSGVANRIYYSTMHGGFYTVMVLVNLLAVALLIAYHASGGEAVSSGALIGIEVSTPFKPARPVAHPHL